MRQYLKGNILSHQYDCISILWTIHYSVLKIANSYVEKTVGLQIVKDGLDVPVSCQF